jgi:phosphate transport system permease protein
LEPHVSSQLSQSASGREPTADLRRRFSLLRLRESAIELSLFLCAFLSILTTLGIIYVLVAETIFDPASALQSAEGRPFFQEVSPAEFFFGTRWAPQIAPKSFGVLPLISGTMLVAVLAGLFGVPIGLLSAVYLSEYATPRVRSIVKPTLEILAGIPTVVYGFFGLFVVTPYVIRPIFGTLLGLDVDGYNALAGGIVVGIMIIPMVCSLSEDALRAVPVSLREAGYALGSTKFDVSAKVVLPAAFSGIVAAFLLAISRAIGETMAVAMCCGVSPNLTANPLSSIQTMTSFIVNISLGEAAAGSKEYKSLYAVALTLFVLTLLMNIVSQSVMRRFREVYT